MHVLFLPKWYPGRNDPQLGDFLRKQAIAVAGKVRVSVLHVTSLDDLSVAEQQELKETDGPWELHCYYRPSSHPLAVVRKPLNALRYRRAVERGWKRVLRERGKPDLVHAHILLRPAMVARQWWRRHRIPYLVSEQSSGYLSGAFQARGTAYGLLARRVMHDAAAVTAVSTWLGDALVKLGLCERYTVVPNVIPGLERPLPAAGTPGQLLMVADLVDRVKNVSGVLRALARARQQDERLQLTIIGDGPDRAMLEKLAAELDLAAHVGFLGRLANRDVLDHMATCWAVVVNSYVETFSVVTGEALAQGRPVIATRCGGPIAFITPENGLLVEPGDDHALAAAMLDLLRHADRFDPAAIRRSVSDRFSYEAVGRAFVERYQHVLDHVGH